MKFCPECGFKFEGNEKFCPECGFKVEQYQKTDEKIKYQSSEEMIKSKLKASYEKAEIFIAPDIPEKKLVNAASVIGKGVNTMEVVGLVDTTILHSGKEGILFMGDRAFLRPPFGTPICIEYASLKNIKYDEKEIRDSNDKVKIERILTIEKKAGDIERFSSNTYGFEFPLKLFSEILNSTIHDVENIETTNQLLQLKDMEEECIALYLKIIMNYLREDDGIIDNFEYKELIGLMSRLNISKDLADKLRDYRIGNDTKQTSELIEEIKDYIPSGSINTIFQSLVNDILSIRRNDPENWKQDEIFIKYQRMFNVSDAQIEFFVRRLIQDRKIIEEKIDDNTIKKAISEISAVGAAAGVSLAALTVTGGISTGIWGGLLTISMASTGGMALGLAAIGGLGYGAYKSVKYFSGTAESERYAIRSTMLQQKIKELQNSENYLIEDINWTTSKIADLVEKKDQILENYDQLLNYIQMAQELDIGSRIMFEEEKKTRVNVYLSHLPEQLDINKYNELVKKTQYQTIYDEFVFSCYEENSDGEYILGDIQDEEYLEKLEQILENIGYFDTAKSAVAKTNAIMKKGFGNLKGILNQQNE